jgi:hypothetical protein
MKRSILLNAYWMLGQSHEDALLKPAPCSVAKSLREEENAAAVGAASEGTQHRSMNPNNLLQLRQMTHARKTIATTKRVFLSTMSR